MNERPRNLDAYALRLNDVRHSFDRAAATYDAAAVLQQRIRDELIERLDVVAIEPELVVDLGCGTGGAFAALVGRFPRAQVLGIDLSEAMLGSSADGHIRHIAVGDAHRIPCRDGSVALVFSNLMLPWCDIEAVFTGVRRVLAPGGLFTFSTFGPDTLTELRDAWEGVDEHTHVNYFVDMHDIGDALLRAGFADPVMDVDRYVLTYRRAADLMHDLKATGARNVTAGRRRALTGKGRLEACARRYERHRMDGRLPATYEIVYGQAWVTSAMREVGGVTRIPVDKIGRRK